VPYPPRRVWLSTALAAVAVFACASASVADLKVTGDQVAWQELTAAFQKLAALSSYKMKIETVSPQGNGTMAWEVLPDRSHATFLLDIGVGEEDITVAGQSRHRLTTSNVPGDWQCGPGILPTDPAAVLDFERGFQGTVSVSRGPNTTIDNVPMRAYVTATTSADNSVTADTTIYVAATTGLPRRAISGGSAAGQSGQATIDYYDFGVPVTISLPPCG